MSDVFDEYCKIMEEKGFVKKEAKENSPTRQDNYQSEDYREKIKALYGLDIKLNNSNKDIIEQAHPETVVISPSYDRMNGIVENLNERHNVMTGIATKPTNGNLTQHRYAKKELLDELVRLGFTLDNDGEEQLAKEATAIAIQVSESGPEKKIDKKAAITKEANPAALLFTALRSPWFWKGVGTVMAWGAVKKNVIGYTSQGVPNDTIRVIESLQELEQVVGGKDKALCKRYAHAFKLFLAETKKANKILENSTDQDFSKMTSSTDVLQANKEIQGTKEEIKFINKYIETAEFFAKNIGAKMSAEGLMGSNRGIIPKIDNMKVISDEVNSEWWEMAKGLWENTLGGIAGGSDPKTKAVNSLAALRNSVEEMLERYKEDNSSAVQLALEKGKSARDSLAEMMGSVAGGAEEAAENVSSGLGKYVQ